MGCDGGTIPKRDELVKTKKKPEQKDRDSELSFRWCHCSITQQPLQKPIVACSLGRLYSKMSVLEGLLDRSTLPETAAHIKNLKDVKELKLTLNPAYSAKTETGDGYVDRQCSEYICPTIGLEMNGKFKFCFIWSCGCVMSERALKEIKDKVCLRCQKPFTKDDIVILNAVNEDLDLMITRHELRQAKIKAEKKDKKQKNKNGPEPSLPPINVDASHSKEDSRISSSLVNGHKTNGTKPEQDFRAKISKGEAIVRSRLFDSKVTLSESTFLGLGKTGGKRSSGNSELYDPAFKKSKSEYSVSKDPNASDVFKSLFTTSSKAQNQTKAHWITYNPFYN